MSQEMADQVALDLIEANPDLAAAARAEGEEGGPALAALSKMVTREVARRKVANALQMVMWHEKRDNAKQAGKPIPAMPRPRYAS